MEIKVTPKQSEFLRAVCDFVLFGGAAGGGKTYANLVDALQYALKYFGSKQLMLRRTFPELERSVIMESLKMYPHEQASYNKSDKKWRFRNGSIIEFGYIDNENDVYKYQSAEYDVIRFDELCHFTQFQFTYMLSRLRGTGSFPRAIKSGANPGGVGNGWVKEFFIDVAEPNTIYTDPNGNTRIFIPSRVQDNHYLMKADPNYIKRLEQLPEHERKKLLDGDWDAFEGRFFHEFNKNISVIQPFPLSKDWTTFITIDYGQDMLAVCWCKCDRDERIYVYRELHEPKLNVKQAAEAILKMNNGDPYDYIVLPPDLYASLADTGKSCFELFIEYGLTNLRKADNSRIAGWRLLREYIGNTFEDMFGITRTKLSIFPNCINLIRCIPLLQFAKNGTDDCENKGSFHIPTHICDAIRYGLMSRPQANTPPKSAKKADFFNLYEDEEEDDDIKLINFGMA